MLKRPESYGLAKANATIAPSMIALIQRVSEAQVRIAGEPVGAIARGILALIGVRPRGYGRRTSRACSSGCWVTGSSRMPAGA